MPEVLDKRLTNRFIWELRCARPALEGGHETHALSWEKACDGRHKLGTPYVYLCCCNISESYLAPEEGQRLGFLEATLEIPSVVGLHTHTYTNRDEVLGVKLGLLL